MTEAPTPPVPGRGIGGPPACEKPRRFQERWFEAMDSLPSQVLRPLREALKIHRRRERRLQFLDSVRNELGILKSNARIYSDSVDAKLDALGVEQVDPTNPAKAAGFVERLGDSSLKALDKRQRISAAIAYGEMTIEWLEWELSNGR